MNVLSTGFLFRAQPTLMTMEASAGIMDSIFASIQNDEARTRLLKIIQDFLISEAAKHNAKDKGAYNSYHTMSMLLISYEAATTARTIYDDVNMDELIGNTDGFADSGYALST